MSEPDVNIRYHNTSGIIEGFWGLVVAGVAAFVSTRATSDVGYGLCLLVILGGIALFIYGAIHLLDNEIKLSLTAEGILDRRTGLLIKWVDIRGVRLSSRTTNGTPTSATVHVKVAHGDAIDREDVPVDVLNLDRSPDNIFELVQVRLNSARHAESMKPEAVFDSLMKDVLPDLTAGIPLSFVTNKLLKRGLEPGAAKVIPLMAAGMKVVTCKACNLEYYPSISSCSACGRELQPAASADGREA